MASFPNSRSWHRFPDVQFEKAIEATPDRVAVGPELATASRDLLGALTYGLELVRCGAMLVTEDTHSHLSNRAARLILEKNDGLLFAETGLIAERASDTRLLYQLIRHAIHSPELGEPKQSPFSVERKSSHTSLIIRVVPGPDVASWGDHGQRAAMLKIYDRDLGLAVDARALVSTYGLTRGEAALTAKLVQGKRTDEAAAELFISPHTARTHLKRIFMKTDTHRQAELVVRMLTTIL